MKAREKGRARRYLWLAGLFCLPASGLFGQQPCGAPNPPTVVTVTSGVSSEATSCLQTSGTVTISGSSAVVFQAGATVYLLPGFTAQASSGTAFMALIGPAVTTTSLPDGTLGTGYSQTLAAAGGTPSYTWTLSSGALPGGLTLVAGTGVISGTPTTAGIFSFTVTATDAIGHSSFGQPLSITVGATGISGQCKEYIRLGAQIIAVEVSSCTP